MANTDKFGLMMQCIPISFLQAIGKIFKEGLRYGRNTWKDKPDAEYIEERFNHALTHLVKWGNGDRSEDHLAKVGWFCGITIEILQTHPEIEKKLIELNTEVGEKQLKPVGVIANEGFHTLLPTGTPVYVPNHDQVKVVCPTTDSNKIRLSSP